MGFLMRRGVEYWAPGTVLGGKKVLPMSRAAGSDVRMT